MSKQKGHDYSTILIWAAALVTVVRYVAAFIASDMGQIEGTVSEWITVAMGLSGLGMGILDVIGGTYLFDGWRRKMPKSGEAWSNPFRVMTFFVFALIVTGVMILVPFTVSRVTHSSMEDVLGDGLYLSVWALFVNVAPYLLIGGVAVGNQVVTVKTGQVTGQMPDEGGQFSDTSEKMTDWRKVKKQLTAEQRAEIARMRTEDICYRYGVQERTARRWREAAQKEAAK